MKKMIRIEDILDEAARYLRGEMDDQEREFFEALLLRQPQLKADVELMRLVMEGLEALNSAERNGEVTPGTNKNSGLRWLWTGLMLTVLIIFVIVLFPRIIPHHINWSTAEIEELPKNPAAQNFSIVIRQLGGDAVDADSDLGLGVTWVDSGQVAVAGTFSGSGAWRDLTFVSTGKPDMLFGTYHLERGFDWIATVGTPENQDIARAIVTDSRNNLILTGAFGGRVDFGDQPVRARGTDDGGDRDFFVAKYSAGGQLMWLDHGGGHRVAYQQTGANTGLSVATDENDHVIVAGAYIGAPELARTSLPVGGPNSDLFLIKYTEQGKPVWTRSVTCSYMIYGYGVEADPHNNIFVTGSFGHHNLGGTAFFEEGRILHSFGGRDIFLAKYDPQGKLVWVQQAGSSQSSNGYDQANCIAVDQLGNSYIAGTFSDEAAFGRHTLSSYGGRDIFLAKYKPDGEVEWIRQAGSPSGSGPKDEQARGLALAPDGSIYITGAFTGTARFGPETVSTIGNSNFYLAKYTTDGALVWIRQFEDLDGFRKAEGNSIDVNPAGQIVVTGSFAGTIGIGNHVLTSTGAEDIFILVINEQGQTLSVNTMIAYVN